MKNLKKIAKDLSGSALLVLAGIVLSILLYVISLKDVFFVLTGLYLFLTSALPELILGVQNRKTTGGQIALGKGILDTVASVLFLFYHNLVIEIFVYIWFFLLPIAYIIIDYRQYHEWKDTLKENIPSFLIGIFMLLSVRFNLFDKIQWVLATFLLLATLAYGAYSAYSYFKKDTIVGNRLFVDEDGDGKFDHVEQDKK